MTYSAPSSQGSFSGSIYTAPSTPGVYTITAYDSQSPTPNSVTATVLVNSILSLMPATATLAGSAEKSFSASGGVPPYTYSVQSGGGSVTSAGVYTAPSLSGNATLLVTDAKGNTDLHSDGARSTFNDSDSEDPEFWRELCLRRLWWDPSLFL